MVIRENTTGVIFGSLALMAHAPDMFRVEVGAVWLTPAARGKGYLSDVMFVLSQHMFDVLKYRRVEWKCDTRNAASKRAAGVIAAAP